MPAHNDHTRRINCRTLRTLHALERTLKRHAHELMALDCEDAEAAEAILFAVEKVDEALEHTRAARRQVFDEGTSPAAEAHHDRLHHDHPPQEKIR